jgi:proliferating cell nuclear antigen
MNTSKYILIIESVKCQPIKQLFESLREILNDCNIQFDQEGIRILAIDGSHVCLVHSRLHADKFVKYECSRKFINAGINVGAFYKLLKPVSSSDTLTFFMEADNDHELHICVKNSEKNQIATYTYKLLDIDEKEFNVPDVEFPTAFTMKSQDFQNLCRHLSNIADEIDIKCVGDQLNIGCEGDFASVDLILRPTDKGLSFITTSDEPIQGRFSLRFLLLFTKATALSQTIMITLKNDFPMIITYTICDLGELKFALSPKVTQPIN